MVSFRLLAVLSVVALLHSVALAEPKCEDYEFRRDGSDPIVVVNERKVVDCSAGKCYSSTFVYPAPSQRITYMAGCDDSSRPVPSVSHECAAVDKGSTDTALRCYCIATTDSPCNTPMLMFDPEGDAGQKDRAKVLRVEMGIVAERKDTAGEPDVDLQYFTCEDWIVKIRPTGNIVDPKHPKKSMPCKGNCGSNIVRVDAENGVDVSSQCWTTPHAQQCTPGVDPGGKYMICYCFGSDCNSAARLFDPEGDTEQKNRLLELRKIGVIAEVKTTGSEREITYKFDDGKTTTELPTTSATEAATSAATTKAPARTTAARAESTTAVVVETSTTVSGQDDNGDDGIDDSATGLSLALTVVLTMFRLI